MSNRELTPTLTSPLSGGGNKGKRFLISSPLKGGRSGGGSKFSYFSWTAAKTAKAKTLRKKQTDAEKLLWSKLRRKQLGVDFRRQHPIGNYVLDFYCPTKKLAVELDGGQHNFSKNQIEDKRRSLQLAKHNIKVLRFWNNDVLENLRGIVETIHENAK